MLSNQAKRQGSFYVCAPCRRQYQQNLAQLRARGRIQGTSLLSAASCPSAPPRPTPKRPSLPDLSPTTRRIEGARSYAAWGKFGSNALPGQNNAAWGAALKNPAATSNPAPAPAWGSGLGNQIPRSKEAEGLRLSWEALTAPPKPKPEPTDKQKSLDSTQKDNVDIPLKAEAEMKFPVLDDLLKRKNPTPRPSPPGAEFPNLMRRESKANYFRNTSPFNLPSEDRRPQERSNDFRRDEPNFGASRSWSGSPDSSRTRSGGPGNQPSRAERPTLGLAGRTNTISSPLSLDNQMTRTPPPQDHSFTRSGQLDDWGYPIHRQPQYEGRREVDARPRQYDEWGNLVVEQIQPGDRQGRDSGSRSVSGNDGQSGEGRRSDRDAIAQTSEQDEEAVIIRRDRKEKESGKSKPKHNKRPSRRNFEDDEDGLDDLEDFRDLRYERKRRKEAKRAAREEMVPKTMVLPEYITVYDLAEALRVKPKQFLDDLEQLGFENLFPDSVMTGETAALVAAEYGFETSLDTGDGIDLKPRPPPEDPKTLPSRPPVVTIMGHVDHGKTTMLDWMRKSSIAAGEHGGITQHIGAFSVKLRAGKVITFLDTPGHAAFLNMRQRGAYVTDIVVLVVAVDDSVMPQTIEALKHAQNAKVPIIVAVNKIDVDPNRMDHVKQDLVNHGVEIEDLGGDVQVVGVSGKTGQGMADLEETILTLSEILDLRAEVDGMAEGWVLEASTRKEGKAATILVKRGTLRVGDLIVAGTTYTRIRIMRNEAGVDVEQAPPGTAVEIFGGWSEPPVSGDMVLQAPDENKAQIAVNYRLELADRAAAATQKAEQELLNREKAEKEALEKELEELGEDDEEDKAAEPVETGPKIVNLIVRGDVLGSVEAVSDAIMEIGNNEVRPRILRSSPGHINESDVDLLATATGYIVNFNNTIPGFIRKKAADAGIPILDHNIIYEVVDNVKKVLSKDLTPITHQRVVGEAEVLQIFAINIVKRQYKNIAGVKVRMGQVTRNGLYRVMRDGEKIYDGKLDALKEGKKNVTEIRKGNECGMSFDGFEDFLPGDIIQHYEEVVEKRYL